MNYMRAIQKLRPNASFSMKNVEDFSTVLWDHPANLEYDPDGKPIPGTEITIPTKDECDAIESEITSEIEADEKDLIARLSVEKKLVEAVALLVVYAGSKADAPQRLKDLRSQVLSIVNDIREGE